MKKESKRILGLFLLGVLFTSVLVGSIGFVSAEGALKQTTDALFGGYSWYDNGSIGIGSGNVAISRILLMVLVALLVYSVADFLPFFPEEEDKGYVKWIFAGVVAVLSFMFVSEDYIKLILTNYEALGVMLTSFVPLAVVIAATIKLGMTRKTTAYFLNPLLIIGFLLYSFGKWVFFDGALGLKMIYIATAILTGIWLIIWKWALKKTLKAAFEADADELKGKLAKQKAKRDAESKSFDSEAK